MTIKERDLLRRVACLLGNVPFPKGGGASSASVLGFVTYSGDMREVIPRVTSIINEMVAISEGAWGVGDLELVDSDTRELEEWIEKRKRENWE